MLHNVLWWLSATADALGVITCGVALFAYISLYRRLPDVDSVTVPVAKLRTWAAASAWTTLLVGLNMARWFALNDVYPLLGLPGNGADGVIDDLTWAICDLLLVIMPLVLISRLVLHGRERG